MRLQNSKRMRQQHISTAIGGSRRRRLQNLLVEEERKTGIKAKLMERASRKGTQRSRQKQNPSEHGETTNHGRGASGLAVTGGVRVPV